MGKLGHSKKNILIAVAIILATGFYIAACTNGSKELPQPTASLVPTKETATSTVSSQQSLPVETVLADLSIHLDVPINTIEVKLAEEVVWPDTCLGIPAPELCARGETSGYRIVLLALGQEYVYHTNMAETFRYAGPGDVPKRP